MGPGLYTSWVQVYTLKSARDQLLCTALYLAYLLTQEHIFCEVLGRYAKGMNFVHT